MNIDNFTKLIINFYNSMFLDQIGSIKQVEIKETPSCLEKQISLIKDLGEFNDKVFNFINVLDKKKLNLNIFNANMIPLKIKKVSCTTIFNKNIKGFYHLDKKYIKISNEKNSTTLEHELLHVATSFQKDNIDYSGFSQRYGCISIGNGLNEGYTQLLTERYFPLKEEGNFYVIEKKYAKIIENIVGREFMQNLYFKADLKGLVDELNKYVDLTEILIFLKNLDFTKTIDKENAFKLEAVLKSINKFVIKVYMNKVLTENTYNYNLIKELIIDEVSYTYTYYLYGKAIDIIAYDEEEIIDYITDCWMRYDKEEFPKEKRMKYENS